MKTPSFLAICIGPREFLGTVAPHPGFGCRELTRPIGARSALDPLRSAPDLANTASARKRIRQTKVRTLRNQARKSRMRTFIKKVETTIAGGDKAAAQEALRQAQPEMQRAAGKGVVHANTIARKLSRLSARIKALAHA